MKDSSVVDNLDWVFHYDIIAELPVEISQNIFLYLPLNQCFKAQRVSRRWHKLLSSPQTIDSLLRWWYPRPETDLCIPKDLSVEAIMNLKAEHIDAFRTGHPFSMSTVDDAPDYVPDDLPPPTINRIAYAHGVLAWINSDPSDSIARSIVTLDLKTHLRRYFIAEDRTSFHTIAMSSSIIAALDLAGRCHVWDIGHSNEEYLLQLPSAEYHRMEASGPALAIASSGQDTDETIDVFTWSSQGKKTKSFLLPLRPVQSGLHREWKIMLDPKAASLFLFQRIVSKRYGASDSQRDVYDDFYFTRTSLDGQICAQGGSECLLNMCNVPAEYNYLSTKISDIKVNDPLTLWLFFGSPFGSPFGSRETLSRHDLVASDTRPLRMIRISFNFERTAFEVDEREFAHPGPSFNSIVIPLIWKNIIYWGEPADADTRIFDFKECTCKETKLGSSLPFYPWENNLRKAGAHMILGDETFLIHVGLGGWRVWCFDKNIQMANEDLGYRRTRLENLQKQILSGVS